MRKSEFSSFGKWPSLDCYFFIAKRHLNGNKKVANGNKKVAKN
jgi:hypothetical protein